MPRGGPPRRPGAREGSGRRRPRRALPPPARAHSRARRAADRQRPRRRRARNGRRRRAANGNVTPARGHSRDRRRPAARRRLGPLAGGRDRVGGEGRRLARVRPPVRHALQARVRPSARPRRARQGHGTCARSRHRHRRDHADTRARGAVRRRARRGGHRRDPRRTVAGRRRAALPRGAGHRVKVTVVGGGIIGCATAYELAKAGCAVTLFERATPGAEASSAAAGMLAPLGDASGSPFQRLVVAYAQAAVAAGVILRAGTSVSRIIVEDGRTHGVVADGDRCEADAVLLAAGAWTAALAASFGARLRVEPARGQMLALTHVPPVLTHTVRTDDVYLVPRPSGELLIGATVERVGFQRTVTAEGISSLLAAAIGLVPSLGSLPIVRT